MNSINQKTIVIIKSFIIVTILVFSFQKSNAQPKTISVESFEKVIISPHIQVVFKEGNKESVTIENAKLPVEKINIEVTNSTLEIYLDDAKMTTKNEKANENGWNGKKSIYNGTMITVLVVYKQLKKLSIRGEETIVCESLIESDELKLNIYGEARIILNEVKLDKLQASMYGASQLKIKDGSIVYQKYRAYGESNINTLDISGVEAKIAAYGESNFRINISETIKISAFGEASIVYQGNPVVNRNLIIGDAIIQKIN